jgi:hypothetical protein
MEPIASATATATYSTFDLDKIKTKIEGMTKLHHIEILKILKKTPSIKLNENKSGVFVNLSFLPQTTIDEIVKYIDYIFEQEKSIEFLETQCENYKNTFFDKKEDKDNIILYSSLIK